MYMSICIYIYICIYMCVCVCVYLCIMYIHIGYNGQYFFESLVTQRLSPPATTAPAPSVDPTEIDTRLWLCRYYQYIYI